MVAYLGDVHLVAELLLSYDARDEVLAQVLVVEVGGELQEDLKGVVREGVGRRRVRSGKREWGGD